MIRLRQLWSASGDQVKRGYAQLRYLLVGRIISPCKFTSGFPDFEDFEHHVAHRKEHPSFGGWTWTYVQFADRFCGGPKAAHILQHKRKSDGAIVRCDPYTKIVGVVHADGFLGTCHVRKNAMTWFQKQQLR